MPPVPVVADRRDHLIVCGEDSLAYRVAGELTSRYGQSVTVLLRSASHAQGLRIAALPEVRVIERAELDGDAFAVAGGRLHPPKMLAGHPGRAALTVTETRIFVYRSFKLTLVTCWLS